MNLVDFKKLVLRLRLDSGTYRKLNCALDWISGIATDKDCIYISISNVKTFYSISFPYKGTGMLIQQSVPAEPTFIIRDHNQNDLGPKWIRIFSSDSFEVCEHLSRCSTRPIRWGLETQDKIYAIRFARQALEHILMNKSVLDLDSPPSPFFRSKADIDVALWVDGEFRGSIVIEGFSLREGILRGISYACKDPRFKPIHASELSKTRIQLVLISPLKILLSRDDFKRNEIDTDKGYRIKFGNRSAWYLPIVFNIQTFTSLSLLIRKLIEEKTPNSSESKIKYESAEYFQVQDFIESADKKMFLDIRGPVVIQPQSNLAQALRAASEWLLKMQRSDGTLFAYSNQNDKKPPFDWPRFVFAAWSLAESGKLLNEKRFIDGAKLAFMYAIKHIPESPLSAHQLLALSYAGRLATALEIYNEARQIGSTVIHQFSSQSFEPILFSQVSGLLKQLPDIAGSVELSAQIENLLIQKYEDAIKKKEKVYPAAWAELMSLLIPSDKSLADAIGKWLASHQKANGSFCAYSGSVYAYTRGTGKIVEVLSLEYDKYKFSVDEGMNWLMGMQYDSENTFFLSRASASKMLGGFRHDDLNTDAWIDAAGHFILASCRILHAKKSCEK